MSTLRDRIERRIRDEICTQCRQEAGCRHSPDDPCALISRLDDIMDAVGQTRDFSLEPYQERVREIVCASCREDATGHCQLRENHECALDHYFPKVVAILEQEFAADPGIPE